MSKRNDTDIHFAVPFRAYSLPLYVAQEKSLFSRNNVTVTMIRTETGHDAYERVANGISDMALVPEGVACRAVFDSNVTILGVLAIAQNEERIIIRTDRLQTDLHNLEGTRVGLLLNSVSCEEFFDLYCKKYAVRKEKVVIERLPYATIEQSLSRGDIDAAVLIEPYASMLSGQKYTPLETFTEKGLHRKYLCLIAHTKTLEKNRDAITSIVDALISAEEILYKNVSEATYSIEKNFGKSVFQTDKIFIDYNFFLHIPPDLETVLRNTATRYFPEKQHKKGALLQTGFFPENYKHRVQLHREMPR